MVRNSPHREWAAFCLCKRCLACRSLSSPGLAVQGARALSPGCGRRSDRPACPRSMSSCSKAALPLSRRPAVAEYFFRIGGKCARRIEVSAGNPRCRPARASAGSGASMFASVMAGHNTSACSSAWRIATDNSACDTSVASLRSRPRMASRAVVSADFKSFRRTRCRAAQAPMVVGRAWLVQGNEPSRRRRRCSTAPRARPSSRAKSACWRIGQDVQFQRGELRIGPDDRQQCPHCARRTIQSWTARHIPMRSRCARPFREGTARPITPAERRWPH